MKIEDGVKYDFNDVLIRPKRSNLSSRSQVNLEREVTFLHSKRVWRGVPLLVANMDTTGTFETYRSLVSHKMITCLHKHYSVEEYPVDMDPNYYAISTGISEKDLEKLDRLVNKLSPYFVVVDVANGYSSKVRGFLFHLARKISNTDDHRGECGNE